MPEHTSHGVKKAGSKKAVAANARPMNRKDLRAQTKNAAQVAVALENPDECTYARIVKPLGFGKYEVMHEKGKTGLATLRGVLCRKRGSPCSPNDICVVERLDGSSAAYKRLYIITGILSPKDAAKLKTDGVLRDGLFKGMTDASVGGGAGGYDAFDWEDLPELGEEEASEAPRERKGKGKIGPAPLTYEEYMAALKAAREPPAEPPAVVAAPEPKAASELTDADIEAI